MSTTVSLLLGGLTGPDGEEVSAGMLVLKDLLKPTPVNVLTWDQWEKIQHPSAGKFVMIGYSGGGTRSIWWANWQHNAIVDLMVLYDPSPRWQMSPIQRNVKHVITYENSTPLMMGLGGGIVTLAHNNATTKIDRYKIAEQHMQVQNDKSLHNRTVTAVRALG